MLATASPQAAANSAICTRVMPLRVASGAGVDSAGDHGPAAEVASACAWAGPRTSDEADRPPSWRYRSSMVSHLWRLFCGILHLTLRLTHRDDGFLITQGPSDKNGDEQSCDERDQ